MTLPFTSRFEHLLYGKVNKYTFALAGSHFELSLYEKMSANDQEFVRALIDMYRSLPLLVEDQVCGLQQPFQEESCVRKTGGPLQAASSH
ncbi:unnamed protein product [Ranitomeya imitator]|uniref:Uncharacterized protein n=1 Tax=Ranitomeya imitator TaxID=111125 RepID=A0ABN9M9X3_9NEOB|nr:unnamed protein product [Ranitomeya imitator]